VTKRKFVILYIFLILMMFACNAIGDPFGETQIAMEKTEEAHMYPPFEDGATIEDDPTFQSADPGPCKGVEVFAEDVRENDALFPDVVVYANAEQISPPDGYDVSYPAFPDSQPLNNNWRIILLDGGTIQVTTSKPVACAGVIFISDYISPASIYIGGELRWNDYLYPPAANNPSRTFYVRVAIEPARPITIQVVGNAPGGDYQAAYVPVYAFGFELP
jgi:hypothetical protein